jgi:hypothetical protein
MLSAGVFGKKKTWQNSALGIMIPPKKPILAPPHTPQAKKLKAEPCVFMNSIMHGLTLSVKDPRLIFI